MLRTILLPIDFSEPSARAARYAAAIAYHTNSLIRAITIVQTGSNQSNRNQLLNEFVQEAINIVSNVLNRTPTREILCECFSITDDSISHAILESAAEEDVDLIIMGTHGRSGISAFLLGSVTESMIHELRKPLLAVGRGNDPLLAEARVPQNILVALDFTETSLAGLQQAVELAEMWHSKLFLLHSVEMSLLVPFTPLNTDPIMAVESESMEQAKSKISDMADQYIPKSLPFEIIVTEGEPTHQILEVVDEFNIDLVVVGPHRHKKLELWILGSTTERLLHKSRVPVWIQHVDELHYVK